MSGDDSRDGLFGAQWRALSYLVDDEWGYRVDPAQSRRPTTIEDVARFTGLSRQTISRVVNNHGKVRPSTRQRVLDAIDELGYRPNSLARGLVTSRSGAVALVVPDITLPFYPEIARGVEDGAYEAGYSVFLCHIARNSEREADMLGRLQGHRVDGAIICNPQLDDEPLRRAIGNTFPVVLVSRRLTGVRGTVIWPGYVSGTALATEHLLTLGRRNLVYIGLGRESRIQQEKTRGFRGQLEQHGLPYDEAQVISTGDGFRGGYEAMESILNQGIDVDAILAYNDLVAIGAMRCATLAGVRVPEDIAMIGFGGSDFSAMVTPGLSTIDVPLYSIGRTAIQELLALIEGTGEQHREVHIRPKLVVRESTAGKSSHDGYESLFEGQKVPPAAG